MIHLIIQLYKTCKTMQNLAKHCKTADWEMIGVMSKVESREGKPFQAAVTRKQPTEPKMLHLRCK